MNARGRPVIGGFGGLLLGLAVSLLLLTTGTLALNSIVVVVLPVVLLILGIVWAVAAPLGPRTPPPGWHERETPSQ